MNDAVRKVRSLGEMLQKKEFNLNVGVTDILYLALCYFMSVCTVFGGRTPFALCAYGASFSPGKWIAYFIVTLLGIVRFRMDFEAVIYIAALLAATLIMKMLRGSKNFRAFCMSATLFTAMLCYNIATDFMWDTFITDIAEATLCYVGVGVFSASVRLLLTGEERKCIYDYEILMLYGFMALFVRCLSFLPLILGMDLSAIVAIIILLTVSLKGEITSGVGAGILMGVALCDSSGGLISCVGAYALGTLCSGILKGFGKWGTVLGFIIANTAMVAFFSGEALPFDIFEILFASVIFALIPRRITSYLSSFSAKSVNAVTDAYIEQDKLQKVVSKRLERLSDAYGSLALSYARCFENKNMSKEYVIHMLDTASSKICPECGLKYNCWERSYKESYKGMLAMLDTAEEKGQVTPSDVLPAFREKCIKLEDFVEEFNKMYEVYKVDKLWQQRLNESRMLVSAQLKAVSHSVKRLAAEVDMCLDIASEKELKNRLDTLGVDFVEVTFLKSAGVDFLVEVTVDASRISIKDELLIAGAVKEITGQNVSKVFARHSSEGLVTGFKPSAGYVITVGMSSVPRNGEKLSGDSCTVCENSCGEFVAAISDGMGTGAGASAESLSAVELLKNFMAAGMDVETALELINSALLLRSSGESFATMDVCVVNTSNGFVRFSKSGAAPGYIINECGVSRIDSDSLPFGVLSDYGKISTEIYTLGEYATIVLVSDGVSDLFFSDEDKLGEFIRKADSRNPQILASTIMKEAMDICDKLPQDDMTVLVVNIRK